MTRGTPRLRGYRTIVAAFLLFGAGILVGHNGAQSVPVPVAQSVPDIVASSASGQDFAAFPTDAPVANLITLRSMGTGDQARFLARMTDPQLFALQTVAVTTPNVLPQANVEALIRGLPELVAGGEDSFGAVQAVPADPTGQSTPSPPDDPGYDPLPDLSPQAAQPCEDCRIVSV